MSSKEVVRASTSLRIYGTYMGRAHNLVLHAFGLGAQGSKLEFRKQAWKSQIFTWGYLPSDCFMPFLEEALVSMVNAF
jgi:hypothetical protein